MATLQEQYNSIKIGNGNKDQFLKQARNLFPQYLTKYLDFDTSISVLKSKQIISEAAGGVVSKGFDIFDWKKILGEEVKATEKETSKEAADANKNAFQPSDMKNADNVNFNEIMKGFYAELRDEKNNGKTGDELKAMVVKNLAKDPLYYTKDGMFGVKGLGYTDEAPGLGKNTQPTSKNASVLGGRSEVNSDSDIVKNSLVGSTKKNVKDTLSNSEAKDSMPKKVKEMPDKGVTGVEKKIKLQEGIGMFNDPIGYKKSELSNLDKMFTKEYKGNGVYVIYKNGEEVKTIEGEGNANAWINNEIKKLKETTDEALYQGPSVKIGTGGTLGGRRFIPSVTVLSKDAIDAINAKGLKRTNWEKSHIKVLKSGEGIKLLVSKPLIDTIVGSERGRSKLPLSVSKMGTGITPEEMSELSGEFKKLIKVLNASGNLSQTGDYYLLDIPTEFNSSRNQFEMPLPKALSEMFDSYELEETDITGIAGDPKKEKIAKQTLIKKPNTKALKEEEIIRSLIQQIIREELNEGSIEINGKTVKTYTQNGDSSYNVTYDDGTKDRIAVSNDAWDEINTLHMNSINEELLTEDISYILTPKITSAIEKMGFIKDKGIYRHPNQKLQSGGDWFIVEPAPNSKQQGQENIFTIIGSNDKTNKILTDLNSEKYNYDRVYESKLYSVITK